MRTLCFTAIILPSLMLPLNASEHQIFYTAIIDGSKTINLNLVSSDAARDRDFDLDVVITVMKKDAVGTSLYVDRSRHLASVRCSAPAKIKTRKTDYLVDPAVSAGIDWKHDLWMFVCRPPMS